MMTINWWSAENAIKGLHLHFDPDPVTNTITIDTHVPERLGWEMSTYVEVLAATAQEIIRSNSA